MAMLVTSVFLLSLEKELNFSFHLGELVTLEVECDRDDLLLGWIRSLSAMMEVIVFVRSLFVVIRKTRFDCVEVGTSRIHQSINFFDQRRINLSLSAIRL